MTKYNQISFRVFLVHQECPLKAHEHTLETINCFRAMRYNYKMGTGTYTKGHERIKPLNRDFFNHTSKTDSESKIITLAMEFFLKLSFTNRMAKSMEN